MIAVRELPVKGFSMVGNTILRYRMIIEKLDAGGVGRLQCNITGLEANRASPIESSGAEGGVEPP